MSTRSDKNIDFLTEQQNNYLFYRQVILDHKEWHKTPYGAYIAEAEKITKWARRKIEETIKIIMEHDS